MALADPGVASGKQKLARAAVLLSFGGVACAITLVFLGMRSVLEIGGACAEGGAFVPRRTCPEGIPLAIVGGIFGGAVCLVINASLAGKHHVPSAIILAWPALFLSLGYNFLDFGLNPVGAEGPVWGWLVCAVVFGLMGGVPLILLIFTLAQGPRGPQVSPALASRMGVFTRGGADRDGVMPERSQDLPVWSTESGDREQLVTELERLVELRNSGALTEDEFQAAKRRVLQDRGR